jgi:hypothetical protein
MDRLIYSIKFDAVRPVVIWNAAILFGWGVIIRSVTMLNQTIYKQFEWAGLGVEVWGIIAILASVLLLAAVAMRKHHLLFAGAFLSLVVYLRSALAFYDVAVYTTTYVNLIHALTVVWLMYRVKHDDQL